MIGHSFGLVNRRSAALNDVFTRLYKMVSFNFYDDKYGFETELTVPSAEARRRNDPLAPRRVFRPEEAPALVSPGGPGGYFQP